MRYYNSPWPNRVWTLRKLLEIWAKNSNPNLTQLEALTQSLNPAQLTCKVGPDWFSVPTLFLPRLNLFEALDIPNKFNLTYLLTLLFLLWWNISAGIAGSNFLKQN